MYTPLWRLCRSPGKCRKAQCRTRRLHEVAWRQPAARAICAHFRTVSVHLLRSTWCAPQISQKRKRRGKLSLGGVAVQHAHLLDAADRRAESLLMCRLVRCSPVQAVCCTVGGQRLGDSPVLPHCTSDSMQAVCRRPSSSNNVKVSKMTHAETANVAKISLRHDLPHQRHVCAFALTTATCALFRTSRGAGVHRSAPESVVRPRAAAQRARVPL